VTHSNYNTSQVIKNTTLLSQQRNTVTCGSSNTPSDFILYSAGKPWQCYRVLAGYIHNTVYSNESYCSILVPSGNQTTFKPVTTTFIIAIFFAP